LAKRNLAVLLFVLFSSFAISAQTSPFMIIVRPTPRLPENSGTLDVTGTIILRVKFLASGSVGDVRVILGLPTSSLVDLAIDAARKIKFEPAIVDGKSIDTTRQVEYVYEPGGWHKDNSTLIAPTPTGCDYLKNALDYALIAARENTRAYIQLVFRPGKDEQSEKYSNRRTEFIRKYLTFRDPHFDRILISHNKSVQRLGELQISVDNIARSTIYFRKDKTGWQSCVE